MAKHEALAPLGRTLHQDLDLFGSTPSEVARYCLGMMRSDEREGLRLYLAVALDQYSSFEMKGHLNRAAMDLSFTSEGAETFLRAVAEQLESER